MDFPIQHFSHYPTLPLLSVIVEKLNSTCTEKTTLLSPCPCPIQVPRTCSPHDKSHPSRNRIHFSDILCHKEKSCLEPHSGNPFSYVCLVIFADAVLLELTFFCHSLHVTKGFKGIAAFLFFFSPHQNSSRSVSQHALLNFATLSKSCCGLFPVLHKRRIMCIKSIFILCQKMLFSK